MSNQQIAALQFIARNPGATAADVTRREWAGRGHAASYARVARLVARGLVARGRGYRGSLPMWLTPAGAAVIGVEAPTHIGVTVITGMVSL